MNREEFRQKAIGFFYISRRNEVGVKDIKDDQIKAFEDGAMFAFDQLRPRVPIANVKWMKDELFKSPEAKL